MLKVAVLVSGGGTNLQAILDAVDSGKITNTEIRVVISNNEGAYALERAKNYGTEGLLLSPKSFETREKFNQKLLEALKERDITCFGQDFLNILAYITDKVTMSFDNFNRVCDHLSVRLQGISSSGPKDIDEFYSEKNEKIDAIIKKLNIK